MFSSCDVLEASNSVTVFGQFKLAQFFVLSKGWETFGVASLG